MHVPKAPSAEMQCSLLTSGHSTRSPLLTSGASREYTSYLVSLMPMVGVPCPHPWYMLPPDWLFLQVCGVSLKSGTYPVPVIPVPDIADLAPVLEASYAIHDRLQHTFHTTFVMG